MRGQKDLRSMKKGQLDKKQIKEKIDTKCFKTVK